jgi:hypothetical protein
VILALLAAALAAPPVDPGLAPEGVEADFRAWARAEGRSGADAEIACRPFAEKVALCFMRREGDARVYVTRADGEAVDALEARARGDAAAAVAGLDPVMVEGFTTPYWVRAVGDGRDHAAILHPDALRAKLGPAFVVAAPARGVLVAWVPGDVVFDKIVAVGVRRMYETLPDPVSPLVYRWDGAAWKTWGEARAVPGETGPSPIPSPSPVPPRSPLPR